MIDNFYRTISPALITRFKEREENVKSDIFHAYIALLRQTKPATGIAAPDPASMEAEEGPVSLLQAQVTISGDNAGVSGRSILKTTQKISEY